MKSKKMNKDVTPYEFGNTHQGQPVHVTIVAKELTRIIETSGGNVSPTVIVKKARPKNSPIHECFEWDNSKAADMYRIEQAKYLLRSVTITVQDGSGKAVSVRAFPNIETPEGNFYTTNAIVMDDLELTEKLETQVQRELLYLRRKGANLKRFKKVWRAVDALVT